MRRLQIALRGRGRIGLFDKSRDPFAAEQVLYVMRLLDLGTQKRQFLQEHRFADFIFEKIIINAILEGLLRIVEIAV